MEDFSAISPGDGWLEYGGSFNSPVTIWELLFYAVFFALGWYFWIRHL